MKVLFLPCYLDGLSKNSASVRWRAKWPARYWDEADVYNGKQRLDNYGAFIFQKFYLTDRAVNGAIALRGQNKILAFDLCDADFLRGEHRKRMLSLLPIFDFAVATTKPIQEWLARWLPAYQIPDRIDLDLHQQKKDWNSATKGKPKLIWFGFAHNAMALKPLLPVIHRLGLFLTIISDEPKPKTWLHDLISSNQGGQQLWLPWESIESTNQLIVQHDIALNPQPVEVDERFAYKSHNKHLTAWSLGLPVAESSIHLQHLMDFDERRSEGERGLAEVKKKWDVQLSVAEWKQLMLEFGG